MIVPLDIGSLAVPDMYNLAPEPLVEFAPPVRTIASNMVLLVIPPSTFKVAPKADAVPTPT